MDNHIYIPVLISFPALSPLSTFYFPTYHRDSYIISSFSVATVLPFLGEIMPEKVQGKNLSYHEEKVYLGYLQSIIIPCYTTMSVCVCVYNY